MVASERREQVTRLCQDQGQYRVRAYMSAGLTNLTDSDREAVTAQLERLYLEVFHPLHVFLYLPHLWSDPGHDARITPEDVHLLDRLRIAESDFLLLCADYPSFGVGQEFEIAQTLGMHVLAYRKEDVRVSRMLRGGAALHLPAGADARRPSEGFVIYKSFDDLAVQLRSRLTELISIVTLRRREEPPVPAFGDQFAQVIREEGLSIEDVAERTGFTTAFVEFLLSSHLSMKRVLRDWDLPDFGEHCESTKFVNPGLWVLRTLSRALAVPIESLVGPDNVSADQLQAMGIRMALHQAAWRTAERLGGTIREYQALISDSELLRVGELRAARGAEARSTLDEKCEEVLLKLRQREKGK